MTGADPALRAELRQSLEVMIGDVLRRSSIETGYALRSIGYGDAVAVTLHKGDAPFVVWLRPASNPSASYRQTALFKIGYVDTPPDRSGYALLDAVCAQVQQWEESLPEGACASLFDGHALGSPNLEMLAVRSGLKPACRYLVSPAAVDGVVRSMHDEGLYTCITEAPGFVSRFRWGFTAGETTIVYVGRTEQAARTAADLERAMMTGWRRWLRGLSIERKLGRALGYPPCCTEAFLKDRTLPTDTIRFRALSRTQGPAAAALNDVDETQSVLSHLVCRYDCAPSLRYAQALLEELSRINSAASEARRLALQGLVVRLCDGGALRLELQGVATGARYRFAKVYWFGSGPRLQAWHVALSAADGLEIGNGEVRILHGDREHSRLPSPPGEVQLRLFA